MGDEKVAFRGTQIYVQIFMFLTNIGSHRMWSEAHKKDTVNGECSKILCIYVSAYKQTTSYAPKIVNV